MPNFLLMIFYKYIFQEVIFDNEIKKYEKAGNSKDKITNDETEI